MTILLILAGLGGLLLGTRWTLNGALQLASRYGLSNSFVGIGILAVGTDFPELFVSLRGALLELNGVDSSGIVAGNALGSCVSNIVLVLGLAAIVVPVRIHWFEFKRDGAALVISVLVLFLFSLDGVVSREEGAVLLLLYIAYFIWFVRSAPVIHPPTTKKKAESAASAVMLLVVGLLVLVSASQLVVTNAITLSGQLGVAQSLVGATIVGLGTSLPEAAVSIGAGLRGKTEMAVGNIIGSNIFNALVLIGLSGVMATTAVDRTLLFVDFPMLLVLTALVLLMIQAKRGLGKAGGALLVFLYLIYVAVSYFASAA